MAVHTPENQPALTAETTRPFFSAIPRDVLRLCGTGALQARDIQVLSVLLDYRSSKTTEVWPSQSTLAVRIACGVDTIQRSLKRLQQAGLIVIRRLRDAHGKLRQCVYDLARLLALLPPRTQTVASEGASHTAFVRPGSPAPPEPIPSETVASHTARVRPKENSVLEEDNSGGGHPAPPAAPPVPVAVDPLLSELLRAGVHTPAALGLLRKHGRDRAATALKASRRRTVQDRAAYIVAFLSRGWDHPDAPVPDSPAAWDLSTETALQTALHRHGPALLLAEMRRRHAVARSRREARAPAMAQRLAQMEAELRARAGTPRNSLIHGSSGDTTQPDTRP